LGLAVSTGVGNSPARARLKRLIRAAFRSVLANRPAWRTRGPALVVSARAPWPEADLTAVCRELEAAIGAIESRRAAGAAHGR
jgi:ribonuclease P protein component